MQIKLNIWFFLVTLGLGAGVSLADVQAQGLDQTRPASRDLVPFPVPSGQVEVETPLSIIEVPLIDNDKPQSDSGIPSDLFGTLKTLDKVTARTSMLTLPVNQPVELKRLVLTMRACRTAPPEEQPETTIFLEIDENKDGLIERIFTGWMFSSSPGIHALEHPIHDVWPMSCKTSDGNIFSGK